MEQLKKNDKLIKIITLILFTVLVLYTGAHHEPWADEAQSWLIARDSSVSEILFKVSRYEGTPMLWHLILKLFITLGLEYKYIYLISAFFAIIGAYIVIFKLDVKLVYKILLPFTYFIFYEYTVKARSYAMLFSVLAGIALVYNNRKEKIFLYNFLLAILSLISLHGAIISGILFLYELEEVIKKFSNDLKLKSIKNELIALIGLSIVYAFIIFSVWIAPDILVNVESMNLMSRPMIISVLLWITHILRATILESYYNIALIILGTLFVGALIILILKENSNKKLFLSIFISEILFLFIIRISNHHIGLIFYTFIFATYLVKDTISSKNKKAVMVMLVVMFIVQVFWTVNTIIPEVKGTYSASRDVANYLKTKDYKNLKIYGAGYYVTAILPYFDENIFYNNRGGHTYYVWGTHNADLKMFSYSDDNPLLKMDETQEEKIESNNKDENNEEAPDIIIIHDNYKVGNKMYNAFLSKVRDSKKYTEKYFKGNIFFKGILKKDKEPTNEGFYVFELKN